jgi:hypothetical protein
MRSVAIENYADQCRGGGGSATLFGHGLDASSLGFGNQALNRHLLVRGRCGSRLLMNGKLLFLQFSYSCSDVFFACQGGRVVPIGLIPALHIRRTCRHAACERLGKGFMTRVFESRHLHTPRSHLTDYCSLPRPVFRALI